MALVARRRLKVGDRFVEPGEPVPEASTWRNLDAYISSGAIEDVPDGGATRASEPSGSEGGAQPSGVETPSRPRGAASAEEEAPDESGPPPVIAKVEVYKDKAGEWRWKAKAKNGRIVATSSEGYKLKRDAVAASKTVQVG